MKWNKRYNFVFLFIFISRIYGDYSNWESYTDLNSVNHIHMRGDSLIISTFGGASLYDIENKVFYNYTKSSGLTKSYVKVSMLINNKIWLGTQGAYLNILNYQTGDIYYFNEFDGVSPIINVIVEDSMDHSAVYVGGNEGFALFQDNKVYRLINDLNGLEDKYVKDILPGKDTLWVLTETALSFFPRAKDLNNPNHWDSDTVICGHPVRLFNQIVYNDNSYWLIGNKEIIRIRRQDGAWQQLNYYEHSDNGIEFKDIVFSDSSVYLLGRYRAYQYNIIENKILTLASSQHLTSMLYDEKKNGLWIGSVQYGLGFYSFETEELAYISNLSGPASNVVNDIDFMDDGTVVFAAGDDANTGKRGGISFYNQGEWQNFRTNVRYPDFRSVAVGNDYVWFASFGSGLLRVQRTSDSIDFSVYDNTNSPLKAVSGSNYVPITNVDKDEYGNIWVLNYSSGVFVPVDPDENNWISFGTNYPLPGKDTRALKVNYNYVWIGTAADGIFLLDYGKSLQLSSPQWTNFNESNTSNLKSNLVADFEMDRYGLPWAATGNGPIYQSGEYWWGVQEDPNYLINTEINDICIDEFNNKYYGTNSRGLIISIGDTLDWFYFNEDNSPLLSNCIHKIKIHPEDRTIWICTDKGINVIRDPLLVPKNNQSSVLVYPNPFLLNKNLHSKVIFDNLSVGSNIRIFRIDGSLVKSINAISSNIGRLEWDGKNQNGQFVSPGVYIYQIVDYEKNVLGGKILIK